MFVFHLFQKYEHIYIISDYAGSKTKINECMSCQTKLKK